MLLRKDYPEAYFHLNSAEHLTGC